MYIIVINFCFDNFLVSCEEGCQDSRGPYSLPGVVEDRRGWPWPWGWFLWWMFIIVINFCFDNFLLSCEEGGQDYRGPYSPSGVVEDRRGWPWPSTWLLSWFYDIWSNFCFESTCQKQLYSKIALKYSSQEHTRPPRIQMEKFGFSSKLLNS